MSPSQGWPSGGGWGSPSSSNRAQTQFLHGAGAAHSTGAGLLTFQAGMVRGTQGEGQAAKRPSLPLTCGWEVLINACPFPQKLSFPG